MENVYHIPAMLTETLDGLVTRPAGVYVDVTLGGGGHSRAILGRLNEQGTLYSFDQDQEAIDNLLQQGEMPENWHLVHSNFRYLTNFMDYYGVEGIDGLLADLGVSFHHFDTPERGFSFRFAGPLDMRMNQQARLSAADVVNTYDEERLARVLYMYGEMKNSRQAARNIVKARSNSPITSIEQLVGIVLNMKSVRTADGEIQDIQPNQKKDLARLFQALRIEVNDEMGALREMLLGAKALLKPGGRIAILTYHSLEDRIVKNFLRAGNLEGEIEKDFYGNILSPFRLIEKGRTATEEEVARNPRSRSAKLRVAEKVDTLRGL